METEFTRLLQIKSPIICGAMYPCSNIELVAAASEAGGIGIIQPLSMVFVHKHDFREGLRKIKTLTNKPVGMNIITEKSSKKYRESMEKWLEIALEEGIRFFVTSLGNPGWVVKKVEPFSGVVFHTVVSKHWAEKACKEGVHGLIAVNDRAGGHAGQLSARELYASLKDLEKPLICAGGIGSAQDYKEALALGFAGIQAGTRFIASKECAVSNEYKQAICNATEKDIVLTEKISGVPIAIINTPYVEKIGLHAGFIARYCLKHHRLKHYMRLFYSLKGIWKLAKDSKDKNPYSVYWQAGKSVKNIDSILSVSDIFALWDG